jgi:tetratricopeptide (TPR) repeat protein
MLYELLAGQHPFGPFPAAGNRKDLGAYLLAQQRAGATPLRRVNPRVDPAVARVVDRCLLFDPERRLASARVLADTLRGRLSLGQRLKRRLTGPRVRLCAAAVLLAAGICTVHHFVTAEPRNALHLRQAREAYARHEFARAAEEFSRVLDLEGDSAAVRFARGRALLGLGKMLAAHEDFRRADELAGGKDGKVKAALAYSCTALPGRENHREAIWYYEQAERAGFKTARLYNNLGWSHAQLCNWEPAKVFLSQAIEQDPALQTAYHNRMFLTIRQGARQLQPVLRFTAFAGLPIPSARFRPRPLERMLQDYLADRQRVMAALEEAIPDMKKALELGPPSATLYHNAARLCSMGTPGDASLGELGVSYVAKAIEQGAAPGSLRHDFLLQMGLGHLPAFRRLVSGPPSGQQVVPCRNIIDPVHDAI